VSGAVFYKKLDTYITPATAVGYDFTTYAQQLGLDIPAKGPLGVFTTTANGSGGNVKGVELAVSLPLNLATSMLDGFGVTASFSNTSSSVSLPNLIGLNPSQQVPEDGRRIELPGLSKTNTKMMVYYEKFGFSAFVAQNKRSSYIGSVANSTVGGYPALVRIDPQSWVSAQVGYEFQSGMFKGLGVRLEGNNLNKPVYREFDGANTRQTETGASYGLKITYKLQ
jgi:iron complex outermembrane recepter protein